MPWVCPVLACKNISFSPRPTFLNIPLLRRWGSGVVCLELFTSAYVFKRNAVDVPSCEILEQHCALLQQSATTAFDSFICVAFSTFFSIVRLELHFLWFYLLGRFPVFLIKVYFYSQHQINHK
ncbi:hypothetical protein XENOCAPTIV_017571 [Xenoophorus captivus]|uniref:Uncharacterized protein n=1 Tax=Xenoophorus captivus TaxID=1517983 RepID=A0ABV0RAX0_9TELE